MKKNTIKSEPFKNFKTSLNIRDNPTPETKSKNPTVFLFSEDEENTKNNNKERYVKIRIIGKDETNHQQDEDVKKTRKSITKRTNKTNVRSKKIKRRF